MTKQYVVLIAVFVVALGLAACGKTQADSAIPYPSEEKLNF